MTQSDLTTRLVRTEDRLEFDLAGKVGSNECSEVSAAMPDVAETAAMADRRRPPRRFLHWLRRKTVSAVRVGFAIASLVALLAILTAIPVLQLITFGYLLNVSGQLAAGGTLRTSLPKLSQAAHIGLAAIAMWIAALPAQLLVHWESVANLIDPGSQRADWLRIAAVVSAAIATAYLLWAWIRGGRLQHYLWPQPKRIFSEAWRWKTWQSAPDRLWDFTASLELPRFFWLGLRGAIGTLVWLIPALIIIVAFREGESGLAGVIGFLSLLLLGLSLLYLPMLQAHFAAENRLRAMFDVREIRRLYRLAPWAWLAAMLVALVITPIPLYVLKIEATQQEFMWLPCLVFVAFILPARIATGLALRRARGKTDLRGRWASISRWLVRVLMLAVVGTYLLFLYVSQYVSWDGLQTWIQQHAILAPVPFFEGV